MGQLRVQLLRFAAVIVAGMWLMPSVRAQGTPPTPSAADGPVHIVTYVDLATGAAGQGIEVLKRYRDGTRKQGGVLGVDVYQEIGRAGRFAIREALRDAKAFEANGKALHLAQLNDGLKPLQVAPADQRRHDAYAMGTGTAAAGTTAVYVMTHVDVPPPLLAELEPQLKTWAQASRKEAGAVVFDVLQQSSRRNHFTVVEGWQSAKAFEAHGVASAARTFRDKLGPMLGALYDQRVYKLVK